MGRKGPDKIGKPVGKDFQVSEWQPLLGVGAKVLVKPQWLQSKGSVLLPRNLSEAEGQ